MDLEWSVKRCFMTSRQVVDSKLVLATASYGISSNTVHQPCNKSRGSLVFASTLVSICEYAISVHIQIFCCVYSMEIMTGGRRSFETCHDVTVYEPMTADTHPSTSKFITLHHLPTCSVMTFSQSYKNPRKPVGINQCLSTFPAAARIHY